MSLGKCKELGLTYDRHGGFYLTANDFYNIPLMTRFKVTDDRTAGKNLEEFRKQFALTMEHFLDLSVDTYEDLMKKTATAQAAGLKLDPIWGGPEAL